MKVGNVRHLIQHLPDDADIGISKTKTKKERWVEIGVGLIGYLLGMLTIRFLFDGSLAESVIGGWILQFMFMRD